MRSTTRYLIALSCLSSLIGADGCPLGLGNQVRNRTSNKGPTSNAQLDVGGPRGALWQPTFETSFVVTLKEKSKTAASKVDLRRRPLRLLGRTLAVADFCRRSDVVCPQSLLRVPAPVLQPTALPGGVVVGVRSRGPFAKLANNQGLGGTLVGGQVSVPLATTLSSRGICGLEKGSALSATAYAATAPQPAGQSNADAGLTPTGPAGQRADRIAGRVTLVYAGSCFAIGGSGALPTTATVELSAHFVARRR